MKKFKKNPSLFVGVLFFSIFVLLVVVVPMISSVDPLAMDVANRLRPPGAQALLGTDEFGRNLWIRILYGGRLSIGIGLSVTLLSVVLGLIMGMYAAYFSAVDFVLMRILDGLMAIPGILLAIALMSAFGPSEKNVVTALTIVYTPATARIVRASALSIKKALFIDAAKIQGASDSRIIWGHIMPNVLGVISVQASYIFAGTVISEASLSFLGAGIPAPTPSWGNIIHAGKMLIFKAPWVVLSAGTAILLSVLSLNLIGDGLRELLQTKSEIYYTKRERQYFLEQAKEKLNKRQEGAHG